MKKLIFILVAFMAISTTAQTKPSYPTVKLTKLATGLATDDVLVIGADTQVKKVAKSSIAPSLDPLEFNATDKTVWNNGKGNNWSNLSFGDEALKSNIYGGNNVAIGYQSLTSNINGGGNTSIGSYALFSNTNGGGNVGIGINALRLNTIGGNNTAIGSQTLSKNSEGYDNVAIGNQSLRNNTTGASNVAIGGLSLLNNSEGVDNVAIGNQSLVSNTIGASNISIGAYSLISNTAGNNNVAIGSNSLFGNTTGFANVAIGDQAGSVIDNYLNNTNSSHSVFIGNTTRALDDSQTNQIVIGYQAIGAGSNTATLGNTSIVKTVLRGTINTASMPVYADNAAATAGGLNVGDQYRTSTGVLMVRF